MLEESSRCNTRTVSFRERLKNRFRFLSWPLTIFEQSEELRKPSFPLEEKTKRTKYPIQMLRYWWVTCAILKELEESGHTGVVVDAGCHRGTLRRFCPQYEGVRWIALDLPQCLDSNREYLELADYDEVHPCDLDVAIPLPDASADIVVCLQVLEHLPRPDFTVGELKRILRPGGLMLVGHPVLPKWVALIRERQLARQFKAGTRKRGQHMHAFWPSRSYRLFKEAQLQVEYMLGTYFLRHRGGVWENSSIWVRINQIWGALFPSLGHELCIQLRLSPSSE